MMVAEKHDMYLSYCEWYMSFMIGRIRRRPILFMDRPPGIIKVLVAPGHK
jgi:hypothetical protein